MYSSLVSHVNISPNKTIGRNHAIDTITIHCVVGQLDVRTIGKIFADPTRKASSNYGVGVDGKVGCYVREEDRSWCSSNRANDNRAITIEVASDRNPPYLVNIRAETSLIKLLVDICQRHNIKRLLWKGDKNLIGQVDKQNMTVHRWFANTACPGDYLYDNMGRIANRVNEELGEPVITKLPYKVKVKTPNLNIREQPNLNSKVKGQIEPGIYTIVDIIPGNGTDAGWGKLKSGVGYISLDYATRL